MLIARGMIGDDPIRRVLRGCFGRQSVSSEEISLACYHSISSFVAEFEALPMVGDKDKLCGHWSVRPFSSCLAAFSCGKRVVFLSRGSGEAWEQAFSPASAHFVYW